MYAVEILIPLGAFAAIFGALYVYLTTRNKERLAMIEKGIDAKIFAGQKNRFGIKLGLLAMGVAIGVLMGTLVHSISGMEEEPAIISMVFLFAGLGLVAEHFLARKEAEKSKDK